MKVEIERNESTVFILGAGFTKSFDKDAPLLVCDINIQLLKEKYKDFPNILKILNCSVNQEGLTNIEVLMSRLSSGMPYDDSFLSEGERKILYGDIQTGFFKKIKDIKCNRDKLVILENFAKYILKTKSNCVTFNYDDMFDRALLNVSRGLNLEEERQFLWTPTFGYGFWMDSALSLSGNQVMSFSRSTSLFLKLHGSINWFPKTGYRSPYPMNAIVHMQNWWPLSMDTVGASVFDQYEITPIIVPPLFDKRILTEQPILRTLWSKAFSLINKASKVVFIGYSMPNTDYLVHQMFKEALLDKQSTAVTVVAKTNDCDELEKRYKTVFPGFTGKSFEYIDAAMWIKDNCVLHNS